MAKKALTPAAGTACPASGERRPATVSSRRGPDRPDAPRSGRGARKALIAANDEGREPRRRYDGFTPAKRQRCLELIGEGHCVAEACYRVRISTTTFYRHSRRFLEFRRELLTAQARAEVPLENTAWLRPTVGAEEKTFREGRLVQVRIKPSDAMLRLLLQARFPKKYGRLSRGGETKKQIEKRLRAEITREVKEKWLKPADMDEMCRELAKRLKAFARRAEAEERLAIEQRQEGAAEGEE